MSLEIISERFTLNGPRQAQWIKHKHVGDAYSLICQTLYSAISTGTELAAYTGMASLSGGKIYPRVNGYMNVAKVLEVGSAVQGYRKDDIILSFNCHETHFIIPESAVLVKLDNDDLLTSYVYAYAYHLGYAALLKSAVPAGAKVAVIGQGLLGQAGAELLASHGYYTTVISDHVRHYEGVSHQPLLHFAGRDLDISGYFDLVILTTGSWHDYEFALDIAGQNGIVSVLGFPGRDGSRPEFNPLMPQKFYQKQLTIQASGLAPECNDTRGFNRFNEQDNLAHIVQMIADGMLIPTRFCSQRKSYEHLETIYHTLLERKADEISAIISWS